MDSGGGDGEMEELSLKMNGYPKDLLRGLVGNSCLDERQEAAGKDSGDMELSLGLSLGGCFGVEPREKRLVRSSSIASLSMFPVKRENDIPVAAPLPRTCSLPAEAEEELRKRKELQCLKRMEAKRKRSEKRCLRSENSIEDSNDGGMDVKVGRFGSEFGGCPGNRFTGLANGAALPGQPGWGLGSMGKCFGPISQGSIVSQRSGSSCLSDSGSRQGFEIPGLISSADDRSPSMDHHSLQDNLNHKVVPTIRKQMVDEPINSLSESKDAERKTAGKANGAVRDFGRNMMEEMPCVATKGDGPNGRRIEGFLYKYRKGEEVRIVCLCHGSFLTPAEFVKHAGGGDVAHPLRHIVVNPSPSSL